MASACVNKASMSPENAPDAPATFTSFGWLIPNTSISFTGDHESRSPSYAPQNPEYPAPEPDPGVSVNIAGDFEFRLEDPVGMLPADELFSGGKLVPLRASSTRPAPSVTSAGIGSPPEAAECRRRVEASATDDEPLFSPKAPSCSIRWRELLRRKKLHQQSNAERENHKTWSYDKSVKRFLHRNSKSSSCSSSANLPLLRDSDCEPDKPNPNPGPNTPANHISPAKNINPNPNPARVRVVKHRATVEHQSSTADGNKGVSCSGARMGRRSESGTVGNSVASVESPRMNSSGKVVFQSLERSSSSPSSFNGGPRCNHRPGIERSNSANVRVAPVLNVVPIGSLRGSSKSGGVLRFFSSPQKSKAQHPHPNCRNRPVDRT